MLKVETHDPPCRCYVSKEQKTNHEPPNLMTIMGSKNNVCNGQSGDSSDHLFTVPTVPKR